MIFKSAKILTELKYDSSDSSSETSSDSDALDFDLEVEESWRVRLANFITEIPYTPVNFWQRKNG